MQSVKGALAVSSHLPLASPLNMCESYINSFINSFVRSFYVLTGKGHTLTWLHSQGIFPLDAFVRVSV